MKIQRKKKHRFLRQEWFRHKCLGLKWRRPRGKQSKLRQHVLGKGFIPNVGYGNPLSLRGVHPSGLREVLVSNLGELKLIDEKTHAIRIRSSVGRKKRAEIVKFAAESGIKVLNPQRSSKPERKIEIGTSSAPKGKIGDALSNKTAAADVLESPGDVKNEKAEAKT